MFDKQVCTERITTVYYEFSCIVHDARVAAVLLLPVLRAVNHKTEKTPSLLNWT